MVSLSLSSDVYLCCLPEFVRSRPKLVVVLVAEEGEYRKLSARYTVDPSEGVRPPIALLSILL